MLLLLDECVPRPLKRDLIGHDVRHVVDMGWSSKRNGELLRLMVAAGFETLITVDQNLEFQQNLQASGIGVGGVVLSGGLYHFPEARTLKRVATFDFNQEQTRAARETIEAFLTNTGAQLWIQHDSIGNTRLKKAPDYYE